MAAVVLLVAGCVETERVLIDIKVDHSACSGTTHIDLHVLRLQGGGLCELERGGGTPPGALDLPAMQLEDAEFVLLGLTHGAAAGCGDAGCADGQPAHCGDKVCDVKTGETCQTCPKDCGQCTNTGCGDGKCDPLDPRLKEDCQTCPKDCGPCANTGCGDGKCDPQLKEDCQSCPKDCGQCQGTCGDKVCDAKAGETCNTCSADCGKCVCGDNVCDVSIGEDCKTCPQDCGSCLTLEDSGAPAGGGSGCVRCFALARVKLSSRAAQVTLKLAPLVAGLCTIPSSAAQALGLPSSQLPPARCQ